jgi:hypothetical protein
MEDIQMAPQIRVDDEVYQFLKLNAEPFIDSPNSVLRRKLGLDQVSSKLAGPQSANGGATRPTPNGRVSGRAKPGELLQIEAYYAPILKSLIERGGTARVADVLDDVGKQVANQLTPIDHLSLPTGGKRWRNRVQWARQHLVEQGLLDGGSPHGSWAITPSGRDYLVAIRRS